jgi:hypothetical protein
MTYGLNGVDNFRIGGFATGSYSCKCKRCGIEYIGDKRSFYCLECEIGSYNRMMKEIGLLNEIKDIINSTNYSASKYKKIKSLIKD